MLLSGWFSFSYFADPSMSAPALAGAAVDADVVAPAVALAAGAPTDCWTSGTRGGTCATSVSAAAAEPAGAADAFAPPALGTTTFETPAPRSTLALVASAGGA